LLGFLPALLAASGLAAGIWGTVEIRRVAAVERALKSTDFPQTPDAATSEDLLRATKQLGLVLEGREDDAEAQYRMARLWIHLYRLRAFRQLREEDVPVANDAGLWQLTLPAVVHGRAHDFARRDLRSELERLRSEPVVRDHLLHALRHLVLARRGCPLLPDVHLMTGALSVLAAEPADDLIHFERVRRLAPADPDLLFRCGVLETSAGRRDAAYGSWRKSLALSPRYLGEILQIADPHMARRQTIETLLPESPTLLIRLARERYAGSERADVREALVQRAEHLIEQGRLPEDERCYLRGSALALKELYPQAIANYSRAVALRVRETGWRYELALALKRQGMLGDAWEQARLCVRMKPDKLEYRTLLEEINHLRLTTSAAKPK
jgi:tetratricopeptide (TPR) repeat protein